MDLEINKSKLSQKCLFIEDHFYAMFLCLNQQRDHISGCFGMVRYITDYLSLLESLCSFCDDHGKKYELPEIRLTQCMTKTKVLEMVKQWY